MLNKNTVVTFYRGCPFDNSYSDTVLFNINMAGNVTDLTAYLVGSVSSLTYINFKDSIHGIIRFPSSSLRVEGKPIKSANYCSIRTNLSSSADIVLACFVTSTNYINDELVEVSVEIDVINTYLRQYCDAIPCYVERRHYTEDGKTAANLVPESFNIGNYVDSEMDDKSININLNYNIVAWCSFSIVNTGGDNYQLANMSHGLDRQWFGFGWESDHEVGQNPTFQFPFGLSRYSWDSHGDSADELTPINLTTFLSLVENSSGGNWIDGVYAIVITPSNQTEVYNIPTSIDGYTPKCKKVLTYPYSYCNVETIEGTSQKYLWELFSGYSANARTIDFDIVGGMSITGSYTIFPKDYNHISGKNPVHGVNVSKMPLVPCESNVYKQWLAQQMATAPWQIASSAFTSAMGAGIATLMNPAIGATAAAVGAVSTLSNTGGNILQMVGESNQANMQPNKVVNAGSIDYTYMRYDLLAPAISHRHIHVDSAKVIDNYFLKYGYACMQIETPTYSNDTWRMHYIKINGIGFKSNYLANHGIDQTIINKINSIFNNGITFWDSVSNFGKYEKKQP